MENVRYCHPYYFKIVFFVISSELVIFFNYYVSSSITWINFHGRYHRLSAHPILHFELTKYHEINHLQYTFDTNPPW